MLVQTTDLTGAALDWAVAKSDGEEYRPGTAWDAIGNEYPGHRHSTDWGQGGPIIEREQIAVVPDGEGWWLANLRYAPDEEGAIQNADARGDTALVAAMRVYVASRLGAQVEVPDALIIKANDA